MIFKGISRIVWILSLVSLFTDAASEMLYPIMPIYLKSIGFSIVLIGLLEGFAEAIAGLSKGYFGKLSDLSGRRLPFVQVGYFLSAISKPLLGLFTNVGWVFSIRFIDRVGKGIRTAPRDAMLADNATKETKATVFGFHRSMDTLGAVIGPTIALIYLNYYPKNYIGLFYLAFLPGLLSISTTRLLKEKSTRNNSTVKTSSFFQFLSYWKECNHESKKLFVGLLSFAFINSSDIFLLLMLKHHGISDQYIIGIYIFYNLVYALFAFPIGKLADKIGLKKTLLSGMLFFAIVYTGITFNSNVYYYCGIFALYGIYAAATEGIAKAWISKFTLKKNYGVAFGFYTSLQSISLLLASSIAGFVWQYIGPNILFFGCSISVIIILIYFLFFVPEKQLISNEI